MKIYTKLLVSFLLVSVMSCEKVDDESLSNSEDFVQKSITIPDDDFEGYRQIILGEERINAYEIGFMRETISFLNDNVSESPVIDLTIEPTHYYIKIEPGTDQNLRFLDELDKSDDPNAPILHEYPLHFEILQEGDYYREVSDEDVKFNYPTYSLIPMGYQFAIPVDYEILAEIYEPTEEQYFLEIVSMFRAGWYDDLSTEFDEEIGAEDLDDLIYFLNHPEEVNSEEEGVNQQKIFRRIRRWIRRAFTRPARYTPTGTINIENTNAMPNALQPFMNAKISIGRNVFWTNTYTDANGNFIANKGYRGLVRIRSKFRSSSATIRKSWNEVLGVGVSDHIMTISRGNNNTTKNIFYDSRRHFWVKATTHNGIALYNDFCLRNGISETVRNANVWAWSKDGDSAAPMLYTYPQLPLIAQYANIGQANLWQNLTANAAGAAIGLVPFYLRPDIIFQGLDRKPIGNGNPETSTIRVHQVVFHESGHFSHAKKVNAQYWAKNVAATISNTIATSSFNNGGDPYRDGSHPSFQAADRISVVEGWGNFTEYKITSEIYGEAFLDFQFRNDFGANSIDELMENFDMYQRPMSANRTDVRSWFLHGLMWDLLDNRNEIINFGTTVNSEYWNGDRSQRQNFIIDNCSLTTNQFNLAPVFNALDGDVENGCDLYWRLRTQFQGSIDDLNELFASYGINCQ